MVSLAVYSMIITSVFASLTQGFKIAELSRDNNRSAQILQNEIERLRLLDWNAINQLPEQKEYPAPVDYQVPYADRYTCSWLIKDRKSGQKELTLSVLWKDNWGHKHSRFYITYFTERGLNNSLTQTY